LFIKSLVLRNFRNYPSLNIHWDPGTNMITGANAQGKSNLLEAINYLSTGASFRGGRDQDIIRWQQPFFFAEGEVSKRDGDFTVSAGFTREGKKVVKVNGNPRKKLSDFVGTLNTVTFSPEDLDIVKSSPARRRKYLDGEMVQLFPYFLHQLWEYQKIVAQRNNLLKEISEGRSKAALLEIWDDQLAEAGSKIIRRRLDVLRKLAPLARLMHRKITAGQEELEILYAGAEEESVLRPASLPAIKGILLEKMLAVRGKEMGRRLSLVGPHRDDLKLVVNKVDAHQFGSQGQQRTVALSLKLAEMELMMGETGEYPVLLLDDVLSELDEQRRGQLLEVIGRRVQTFITATDADFGLVSAQLQIKIAQGKIISDSR